MTIVYHLPIVSNWLGTAQKWAVELRKKQPLGVSDFVWNDWDPTFTCSGTMTISGITVDESIYCVVGGVVWFNLSFRFTLATALSFAIYATAPVDGIQMSDQVGHICAAQENGAVVANGGRWRYADGGRFVLFKPLVANWVLGANGGISVQGFYRKS